MCEADTHRWYRTIDVSGHAFLMKPYVFSDRGEMSIVFASARPLIQHVMSRKASMAKVLVGFQDEGKFCEKGAMGRIRNERVITS